MAARGGNPGLHRRAYQCANPDCQYLLHDDPRFGGFCCKVCHYVWYTDTTPEVRHGDRCQRMWRAGAPKADPIPPSEPLRGAQHVETPSADEAVAGAAGGHTRRRRRAAQWRRAGATETDEESDAAVDASSSAAAAAYDGTGDAGGPSSMRWRADPWRRAYANRSDEESGSAVEPSSSAAAAAYDGAAAPGPPAPGQWIVPGPAGPNDPAGAARERDDEFHLYNPLGHGSAAAAAIAPTGYHTGITNGSDQPTSAAPVFYGQSGAANEADEAVNHAGVIHDVGNDPYVGESFSAFANNGSAAAAANEHGPVADESEEHAVAAGEPSIHAGAAGIVQEPEVPADAAYDHAGATGEMGDLVSAAAAAVDYTHAPNYTKGRVDVDASQGQNFAVDDNSAVDVIRMGSTVNIAGFSGIFEEFNGLEGFVLGRSDDRRYHVLLLESSDTLFSVLRQNLEVLTQSATDEASGLLQDEYGSTTTSAYRNVDDSWFSQLQEPDVGEDQGESAAQAGRATLGSKVRMKALDGSTWVQHNGRVGFVEGFTEDALYDLAFHNMKLQGVTRDSFEVVAL